MAIVREISSELTDGLLELGGVLADGGRPGPCRDQTLIDPLARLPIGHRGYLRGELGRLLLHRRSTEQRRHAAIERAMDQEIEPDRSHQ